MKKVSRIKELLKLLSKGVYEKEHIIAMALLSAIAGESIFLLGPTGTAKSLNRTPTATTPPTTAAPFMTVPVFMLSPYKVPMRLVARHFG